MTASEPAHRMKGKGRGCPYQIAGAVLSYQLANNFMIKPDSMITGNFKRFYEYQRRDEFLRFFFHDHLLMS
jgi:hypothetical protein